MGALLLGAVVVGVAAWAGCGHDEPARCDEALGYACQKGAAGASGVGGGGAGPGGASGDAGTGGGTAGLGGGGNGGSGDTSEGKGEVAPYALAQDDTSLYWVSPAIKGDVAFSRMRRVLKTGAGGLATNAFSSTIVRARSPGFAEGKLYWGDLGANPGGALKRGARVAC